MAKILITGCGGLVGSAAVQVLSNNYEIVGIDNDLRKTLLNDSEASTRWNIERLERSFKNFKNHYVDVRDKEVLEKIYKKEAPFKAIIHCAAQTAHEGKVLEDFSVNTVGTLNLLDMWMRYSHDASFLYMSTIKVYGHYPNTLDYIKEKRRFSLPREHRYHSGFDESVSIDQGMSSFFGRSKTAADLYVQEYLYQHQLKGACFRASCITGGYHAGTESHGMLNYMMRCVYQNKPYHIYGYEGYQVRDQLHADDLAYALACVIEKPSDDVVYNLGGGLSNSCSMLEAIEKCEKITGKKLTHDSKKMRKGDHIWWVTDNSRFLKNYPNFKIKYSLDRILEDIYVIGKERW